VLLAFFPWLRLSEPIDAAGVRWFPAFRGGLPANELHGVLPSFTAIIGRYVDVDGSHLGNAVVAQVSGRAPEGLTWNDEEAIGWSKLLLFLSALSRNDYFTQMGSYTNGSAFQLVFQEFVEPAHWIALSGRRLDGGATDGRYTYDD
jgi:hypothetical protein